MFCPRCSRKQDPATRWFCAGCGLRLDGIARLLSGTDGEIDRSAEAASSLAQLTKQLGVRLMFFSLIILPLILFFAYRYDSPLPFTIPSLIFLLGLAHTAYTAMFGARAATRSIDRPASALHSAGTDADIKLLMARLNAEIAARDEVSPLVVEGLMLELIAVTSRNYRAEAEAVAATVRPAWLAQVEDHLRQHFASPLTSADLAATAGVHPTHLARTFRQFNGKTVGEYVRHLRIDHSCRLLLTTEAPLSEIALAGGFYDQSHFTRCFRQLQGLTPSEFRAAHQSR